MKKNLILVLVMFMSNLIFGQNVPPNSGAILTGNPPNYVEFGINENFPYSFIADPITSTFNYSYYKVVYIGLSSFGSDINNTGLSNYNTTAYASIRRYSPNFGILVVIPIKWNINAQAHNLRATYFVNYYNSNDEVVSSQSSTIDSIVPMRFIANPTISSTLLKKCCTDNVTITASNYGFADNFFWDVTNGTIVAGQGTNTILVTPDSNPLSSIGTNCVVKRNAGLPSYTRSGSRGFPKIDRTANFLTTPDLSFVCQNNNIRTVSMDDQCGISNVVWTAPNCTISAETIANGKRTRTITPNASVVAGATITIFATVNFVGGCSAVTPTQSFVYYTNVAPPIPLGNVKFPLNYYVNINNQLQCSAPSKITPIFEQNIDNIGEVIDPNYVFNGQTTVSPALILVTSVPCGVNITPTFINVTVCNVNPCTGVKACKVFRQPKPVCVEPCNPNKNATINKEQKIVVSPNPNAGNFNITLVEKATGDYRIFNSFGFQIQDGKFNDTNVVNVNLEEGLKSDIYLINVTIGNKIYSEKIILKK